MARHGENIYKRKDGRYEGRYVTGKKSNGTTRFGYVYGMRYTDVKKRLLEKKAEIQQTIHPEAAVRGMTVEKWMRSWLETDLLGGIKASSYLTYQNQMNRHILPCLGRMQMASITPEMVHSFLECLQAKGLGENTVRGIYRLLSAAMRAALDDGIIAKNPCRKICVKRGERVQQRVFSREEQKKVEKTLSQGEDLTALFAMYTGLRLGEICGLRWSDINWENGTATVCRTVQRLKRMDTDKCLKCGGAKTYLMIGSPKSSQFLPDDSHSDLSIKTPGDAKETAVGRAAHHRLYFWYGNACRGSAHHSAPVCRSCQAAGDSRRPFSHIAAQLCHKTP